MNMKPCTYVQKVFLFSFSEFYNKNIASEEGVVTKTLNLTTCQVRRHEWINNAYILYLSNCQKIEQVKDRIGIGYFFKNLKCIVFCENGTIL